MNILFSYPWKVVTSHGIEVANNFAEMDNFVHFVTFWKDRPLNLNKQLHFINASIRNRHFKQFFDYNLWQYGVQTIKSMLWERKVRESLQRCMIEKILNQYSIEVIYERLASNDVGVQLAYRYDIPLVLEVNGIWPIEARQKGFSQQYCDEALTQELDIFSKATRIRAVSRGVRDFYVEHGIDPAKFKIIGNGANVEIFRPMDQHACREQLGFRQDERIVGFVGSFQFYVGLEHVIAAIPLVLRKISDVRFFLMGREMPHGCGPSFQELLAQAKELGVADRLTLASTRPYDEMPRYVNAFDVCLVPLIRERNQITEVSPLKLYEYMACEKSVIASKISGNRDLEAVQKNNIGLLCEPENSQDLAEKIIYLLTHKNEALWMGKRGRHYVVNYKSWRRITQQILELLKESGAKQKVTTVLNYVESGS